jgi:3-deoxy-D-manno-octulosonic acid kinase
MIVERLAASARGCILYDASRVRKAVERVFDPLWWAEHGTLEEVTGGRASIALLRHEGQCWVLRHYRRGGFMARISTDRYLWTGQARVRAFAEWRLLARMQALKLPVPTPIAARYERRGPYYTADLITEFVPQTQTLAAAMRAEVHQNVWRSIGSTLASFHAQGVHHADLNANNVLLKGASGAWSDAAVANVEVADAEVYVIDFDRGRIRSRGAWEAQVLARLRRSLDKVSAQLGRTFDEQHWCWVMEGYVHAQQSTHLR